MKQIIYQVDSFTKEPFKGNPAGVCIMQRAADENWMRKIAAEMNLSETAFLYPEKDGYNLRWFTPAVEVELCGHATLASAHILWEQGQLDETKEACFFTLSGLLKAKKLNNQIELNFPAAAPQECTPPQGLLDALGVNAVYIGKNKYDYLVELNSVETVKNVKPDFTKLKELGVRGVMITAKSDDGKYDFVSRFFAPGAGIDEDPVTGSAHCALGPYWAGRLNKTEFKAFQASQRGGEVGVIIDGDRVRLLGDAITVFKIEVE